MIERKIERLRDSLCGEETNKCGLSACIKRPLGAELYFNLRDAIDSAERTVQCLLQIERAMGSGVVFPEYYDGEFDATEFNQMGTPENGDDYPPQTKATRR